MQPNATIFFALFGVGVSFPITGALEYADAMMRTSDRVPSSSLSSESSSSLLSSWFQGKRMMCHPLT